MHRTPLSPVMAEATRSHDAQCINFVQVKSADTLHIYFIEKIISQLINGQSIALIVPDGHDLSRLGQLLSDHRLAHLTAVWSSQQRLDLRALKRFRTLAQLGPVARHESSYRHLGQYISELQEEVQESLHTYYRRIEADQTLKSVIARQGSIAQIDISPQQMTTIRRTAQVNNVLAEIDTLAELYQARFELLAEGLLQTDIYSDKQSLITAKHELSVLTNFADKIRHDYHIAKKEILKPINQQLLMETNLWRNVKEDIRHAYYTHDIELSKVDYTALMKKLLTKTAHCEYLTLSDDILSNLTWQNGEKLLQAIDVLIRNSHSKGHEIQERLFKRLTPFNTQSDRMTAVLSMLQELKEKVEETPYIQHTINANVLTLNSLSAEIETIHTLLQRTMSLLQDTDHNHYRLLQSRLNMSDTLVRLFSEQEHQTWSETFVQCLYQSILYDCVDTHPKTLQMSYDRLRTLYAEQDRATSDIIHNVWCQRRKKVNSALHDSAPDIFQNIFYQSESTLSIAELYGIDPAFVMSYFPIMIVEQSATEEIAWDAQHISHVSYIQNHTISPDEIKPVVSAGIPVDIVTDRPLDVSTIQSNYMTHIFFPLDGRYTEGRDITTLQKTDRYRIADTFGRAIYSMVGRYSVYQLKDKSIISLLDPTMERLIIEALPQRELNVLYYRSDQLQDLIDGFILDGSAVYLLTENGLINDREMEHFHYQSVLLDHLRQSGIQIVDINTYELTQHYSSTIHNAIAAIHSSTQEEPKSDELSVAINS